MYEVTVDAPNLSDGAVVEIDALGFFTQGEPRVVPDEDVAVFMSKYGKTPAEAFANDPTISVEEVEGEADPAPEVPKPEIPEELVAPLLVEEVKKEVNEND